MTLRQTDLRDYLACPRRFELRVLRGVNPVTAAGMFGTAFHRGMKILAESLVAEPVEDVVAEVLQTDLGGIPIRVDRLMRLLAFGRIFLDAHPPKMVEKTLSFEVDGYRLQGTLDLLDVHGCLWDYKTGRHPAPDAAEISFQLSFYAYALCLVERILPEEVGIAWFGPNRIERFVSKRSGERLIRFRDNLEMLVGAIKRGSFPPRTASCRFCTVRPWCEYGRR